MLSLTSLGPAAALQPLARTGLRCFQRPAMLILLLLAFGLRTYQLDSQSLRGDEAASVHYSAMPITELWELSRVTDPHPPFYYLMLHVWQWGLGRSAWAMRFAGVMASVVAVAALYGLARRTLCWPTLSLLAAGLLAINPLQIWLAQDIRSYPFFTLLGLLSAGALWRALRSNEAAQGQGRMETPGFRLYLPRFRPWFLYILLTVASFYIHYYTVFLIAFEGLFVLANINKFWRDRWLWLVSQIVIGLLIIPGLLLAYNFVGQAAGGIETVATPDLLRLASTALLTGFTISDGWGLWLSLLLAPVWLVGLAMLLRRDFLSGLFWLLFFAAPVLGVILLSLGRPFFKERFLIQGQPAFELLLAAGFLSLASRAGGAGQSSGHTSGKIPPGLVQQQLGRRFTFYTLRFGAYALFLSLLFVNTFALRNYFADPVYAKAPPWRFYYD